MDLKTHRLSIFHVIMGLNLKPDIKRVHSSPTCHCSVTFGYLGFKVILDVQFIISYSTSRNLRWRREARDWRVLVKAA